MLIAGTGIIYLAKYAAVRFSGWAFRVEGITEHYLFNVFLINKVLGVTLVPFIIILAFADPSWAHQVVFISFIAAGVLILNRYIRSWQIFGSFFQYSKFHFFMYLCASELLPLAVLMKLLVKGLMFY
jgi:Na+-translocating ferredoxin:NAD+ oxidoreductase RnfD subunit